MKEKVLIYARCSTDEQKQDVELQLKELRKYCENQGWEYDEISEYVSGFKGIPKELRKALERVGEGYYKVFIVHSLSRLSRLHPKTTEKMLDFISERCRFISLQENLDSDNEMLWYSFKGFLLYMNNLFSRNLSEKTKLGMKLAKQKGQLIGRPKGSQDKKPRSKKGYYLKTQNTKGKLPF